MIIRKICLSLFLALVAHRASGQGIDPTGKPIPARSPVVLLSGYKLEILKGIDTDGARIWNDKGVVIEFGQGMYLEDPIKAIQKSQILWEQEQKIDKYKVQSVYTKSRKLIVNFPELHANFGAKIRNQRELADVLLMVVTYNIDGYSVEPALIAPMPKKKP